MVVTSWQYATVEEIRFETYRVKTVVLRLPNWVQHIAGQHYDVRLTAPDGYHAQRSYSVGSAPSKIGMIEFTIELIPDGEISGYFFKVLKVGDQLEVRGPLGGPFTWSKSVSGPLFLIGGGTGIVPLMSIFRDKFESSPQSQIALLYSIRSEQDIIFSDELKLLKLLDANSKINLTFTRIKPVLWEGDSKRIDLEMISGCLDFFQNIPNTYICGSSNFVSSISEMVIESNIPREMVRTERFYGN
ncbi:MAG: FAD-binding oxidoreductase [SAR202 cluster bacterium]|nr:FAD-binding oxidoreductase [SAR202 cluster bacterium]